MTTESADESRTPPLWRRPFVLGCLAFPALLVVVTLLGGWLWYQGEMSKARRELQTELKYLRDRGAPLTSLDIDAAYQPDPDAEDITAELLKVLVLADDQQLQALAKTLPIVGTNDAPPAAGTDWPQLAEVEAYLAKHRSLLDVLATLPDRNVTVRFPADYALGPHVLLPHAQQARHAARVLKLQAHVDMHHDRPPEVAKRIAEILALENTLKNEPTIVSQLVRSAINSVAVKTLQEALAQTDFSDADLAKLQLALRRYDSKQAWGQAMQGERAICYTASTMPLRYIGQPTTRAQVERLAERGSVRPHDAAFMLRLFRQMEVANDQSITEAIASTNRIDVELKQLASSRTKKVLYMQTLLMMPSLTIPPFAIGRTSAYDSSADVALAAVRFRQANRVWPQQLGQLVPEFLPQVPLDPFDGKPLRFVATDAEFKVYSVGKDLIDQGGDLTEPQMLDVGFVAPWREGR